MNDRSEAARRTPPISELLRLHRDGRLGEAAAGYRRLLASYERAERRSTEGAQWQVALANLAAIEAERGELDEAVRLYERAYAIAPEQPSLAYNLACLLDHRGDHARAAELLSEVCVASPEDFDARLLHARSLRLSDQPEAAASSYARALELRPDFALGHRHLGNLHRELGRPEQAVASYRRAAALGDPIAPHLAAALSGDTTEAAPADYVRALFDHHAEEYDSLLDALDNRGPQLLRAALRELGPSSPVGRALDLGCGTGLCAPLLVDRCAELVGVDLSPQMLRLARERGVYDSLEEADVVAFLRGAPRGHWDLILAGDVLCYLGELSPLMSAVQRALAPDGHFVFTVERTDGAEHELQDCGRYRHSAAYLQRLADEVGLVARSISKVTLRHEGDHDVPGLVVTLRRPRG